MAGVLETLVAIAPVPLLPGEKERDYLTIAERIAFSTRPRDAIEEFLIRDAVDLTWEILRLRRLNAGILKSSMGQGVKQVLTAIGHPYIEIRRLSESWVAGDDRARKKVDELLSKAGLTLDEVTAQTLRSELDSFERIERMLASAEARRNNALREIDRHREALGAALRQSIEEIEDAEFQDVETGRLTAKAQS